jgi:hypothetical protein
MAHGIYRDGEMARVRYEGKYDVQITRQLYNEMLHLPLFEALPTREEYERAAEGVVIVGSDDSLNLERR